MFFKEMNPFKICRVHHFVPDKLDEIIVQTLVKQSIVFLKRVSFVRYHDETKTS